MAGPFSIDTLNAITEKYFIPKLVDNVFLSSPLLFKLRENEVTFDGGTKIEQPISYTKNPNAGSWAGKAGTLKTQFIEHVTDAEFNYGHYYVDITLAETEILKNAGNSTKVIDIVKAQSEMAEESLIDTMGVDVYGDGSDGADGEKKLLGLQAILTRTTDPASGAYGGITRVGGSGSKNAAVGNGFWNANVCAINAGNVTFWRGPVTFDATDTILDLDRLNRIYQVCCAKNESPDLIVMGIDLFTRFWTLQQVLQRIVDENEIGKVGFKYLMFNSTPVVIDDNIDSQSKVYVLNTKHLYLRPHKDSNFVREPFQKIPNQRMHTKFIFFDGQITSDRPNLQGGLTGVTSS